MTSWNGKRRLTNPTPWQAQSSLVEARPGRWLTRLAVACLVLLAGPAPDARAAEPAVDLGNQVLPIFAQKCGTCHGPQAKKKEKFGYVTDLVQLAGNPKLVVPGDSGKSKMWTTVKDGDMPPSDDERSVPLTDPEKDAIKAWIDAGAPPEKTTIAGDPATTQRSAPGLTTNPTARTAPSGGPPIVRRLFRLVGKLHPLLAHFPIALLMMAAVAEAGWFFTRNVAFTASVRFCTLFGALGALGAGALGWVNAYFHTASTLLTTHRWLGTVAGLWAIPLLLMCEAGIRRAGPTDAMSKWGGRSRMSFQLVLFAGVTLIGVAAHIGGQLVYGEDYFNL